MKITTLDYKEPKIRVEAWPNAAGEVKVEILEKQIVTRKAVAGESADQTDETIELCIDENAVQPTVQILTKHQIRSSPWKFSRQMVNFPEKLPSQEQTCGARMHQIFIPAV